jgi:hypothetical protein
MPLVCYLHALVNFTFIWPCIVTNYFSMKPTDALVSKFIFVQQFTCFGYYLYPSSGVSCCTFGSGTCYTGLTTASVQNQNRTSSSILSLHASCCQNCITRASAEGTVANSSWGVEELPETRRLLHKDTFGNECVCWFHWKIMRWWDTHTSCLLA